MWVSLLFVMGDCMTAMPFAAISQIMAINTSFFLSLFKKLLQNRIESCEYLFVRRRGTLPEIE
jgi:hypothetical protein